MSKFSDLFDECWKLDGDQDTQQDSYEKGLRRGLVIAMNRMSDVRDASMRISNDQVIELGKLLGLGDG